MLMLVFLLVYIYFTFVIIWVLLDVINVKLGYTINNKEYITCDYPSSKKFLSLVNIFVIFGCSALSYANRNVRENFKEDMSLPSYTNLLFIAINEILNYEKDISINVLDLFNAFGYFQQCYKKNKKFSIEYFLLSTLLININSN
ncbi:hypothetical protein PIROE2DRAFT_7571 [Piromyces sp. E2]|nr:hypothetical protein PIROE2DRAFT_7571 [Piromyces sp. E2]|eukprot:OUM65455.1 hypothetical protein PIROE2DRAFT_7571 [Piromyces sp. E2]